MGFEKVHSDNHRNRDKPIPLFLLSYQTAAHGATGETSAMMLTGQNLPYLLVYNTRVRHGKKCHKETVRIISWHALYVRVFPEKQFLKRSCATSCLVHGLRGFPLGAPQEGEDQAEKYH